VGKYEEKSCLLSFQKLNLEEGSQRVEGVEFACMSN
jgi:hypothetical protein